ncbi:hypothetical protein A8B78_20115 [Jannaschia sp. EhC01]|nr:hypothetical protein A8B78_20115 [Jannaschia sp. EhC01]
MPPPAGVVKADAAGGARRMPQPGHDQRPGPWLARIALRLLLIAAIALVASKLISLSMDLTARLPEADQGPMQLVLVLSALAIYALLIAIPFVPGIEVGIALLLLRGASIAPAVYLATLTGLLLAYFIGRLVPDATLERAFRDVRLHRAADLIAQNAAMTPEEREGALHARLPLWLRAALTRYRYVTLALLINLPGNAFLGGGGGLMIAAGLSHLFAPRQTILTLMLAVLPFPFTIWWFGTGMLGLSSG